jgi:DNA-binding beta-propeller fold protein YncE
VTDGAGKLYVNINDKNEIAEIDSRSMKVVRRWPLAPCEDPSGLALDAAHARLYSVCGNKLMAVSDIKRGAVIGTAKIGDAVDATAYDPATGDAFASNGDGTLTVVHESAPGRFRVVQTVKTMAGARTMALDPKSHRLYTVAARTGPMPAARPGDSSRRRAPMIPGTFSLLVLER